MLFNSYIFLFIFLPITLVGYYVSGKLGLHRLGIIWLVIASLFFYGWWNPVYLILLLGSIFFNFFVGAIIRRIEYPNNQVSPVNRKKALLIFGLLINLFLLGYFKYANFFVTSLNDSIGTSFNLSHIILPLGISFFTFTQIAYLVDAYRGEAQEYSIINYLLFVSFFPHLIAGPILHHKEMMPQFLKSDVNRFNINNFAIGLTVFVVGLFKKVIFADTIAVTANALFNAAAGGASPTFFEAWIGAIAYSLQLYFDFSGYSDMAIGLAMMCNIKLPANFNSPYKSNSIIDFWRRWHMTLSRFLRDYLYIPLGGNRKGKIRRYINLMVTMILGGLWHGADWTFAIWGMLHGIYLVINNAWRWLLLCIGKDLERESIVSNFFGRLITLAAVIVAWVFFRATNLTTALRIVKGMMGKNGISLPFELSVRLGFLSHYGIDFNGLTPTMLRYSSTVIMLIWLLVLMFIALFMPTILDLTIDQRPALGMNEFGTNYRFKWRLSIAWALIVGFVMAFAFLGCRQVSEFLYFQF